MATELPVLVVEDDPNLREAVCDTLELAGQTGPVGARWRGGATPAGDAGRVAGRLAMCA